MIDPPKIVDAAEQLIAFIPLKIPRAEIRAVMGPGISELRDEIAIQGVAAAGPWFTHHLRMHPEFFDFEISLPVAGEVAAAGRMKTGVRPAMRMARTVYEGPYEGLGAAWREFDRWIGAEALPVGQDLWECYLQGPEAGVRPERYLTELSVRL